jgi:hypothetical protein
VDRSLFHAGESYENDGIRDGFKETGSEPTAFNGLPRTSVFRTWQSMAITIATPVVPASYYEPADLQAAESAPGDGIRDRT